MSVARHDERQRKHERRLRMCGSMNAGATRGVVLMSVAMLVIPVAEALAKYLSEFYSPLYISWARYIVASVLVVGVAKALRRASLFPKEQLVFHFARTVCLMASMTLFFVAVSRVPLATATAAYFVAPFIATILAVVLLKESLTLIRIVALACGTLGAVLILEPGSQLRAGVLFAMAAGVFFALYMVTTRIAASTTNAVSTLVFQCVIGMLLLSPQAALTWTVPAAAHLPAFIAIGIVSVASHLLSIAAFSHAPASTLAPLVYLELVSSALIGFAIFGEVPAMMVWIGAAIIVAGGLLLLKDQ